MIIDALDKTIQLKIVYFGPALSGKTTSMKSLFNHFGKDGEICSIESTVNRTLFFDYGTIKFQNRHWLLKVHVYSTTGQDFYIVTRPITLRAIDGIIFVVDSQKSARTRNIISWNELNAYFREEFKTMPKILAFNKQDVPEKFNVPEFLTEIRASSFENLKMNYTVALSGEGILECFEDALSMVFKSLYNSELVPTIQ